MIHIDNGWDTNLQSSWFSSFLGAGVVKPEDFDVFGFSFYPFYGTGATFSNLNRTLWTIADRYKKPIHVAETNWPFTCASTSSRSAPALSEPSIPIGARGQVQWVKGIIDILKAVPGGLGAGIHYWEPGWLNNTSLGSGCGDNILFTADWAGWPDRVKATAREGVGMFS
jgi:arabinogalactan endo-1,4-beta-galactosidase